MQKISSFLSFNLHSFALHPTFYCNLITNRISLYFLYVDKDDRHRHFFNSGLILHVFKYFSLPVFFLRAIILPYT